MLRNTLIAAAFAAATLTAGAASASASDLNSAISGNAPITQVATTSTDGAAGFKNRKFKIKFKFKRHYKFKHFGRGHAKGCFWYKRKYHRTGHIIWLKKYKRCIRRAY